MDEGMKILAGLLTGVVMIGVLSMAVMGMDDNKSKPSTVAKSSSNTNLVIYFDSK